jgi:uncharacterized protein (DUF362 family)/Pyruvate/2-oxoacid:ferredoxin oxidoreductase delta subunit
MEPTVSLIHCPTYDPVQVEMAVRHAVGLLGGMRRFVQPGQRALVKPNLLLPSHPDKAIVTHPSVVRAVVRLVQEADGRVLIADNPASPLTRLGWPRAYEQMGLAAVAAETGAELNDEFRPQQRSFPEGHLLKVIDTSHFVTECDVTISVSKLKTHSLMRFTGAIKNLFGTVPGMTKVAYHAKLQTVDQFANMLLDVAAFARPVLNIMDAVVGMDGDGPSGGQPFPIGAILAGPDPVAVDVAALSLVGCEPASIPTVAAAVRRGWSTGWLSDLALAGDDLALRRVDGFRLPPGGRSDIASFPQFLRGWAVRHMVARPVVTARCVDCGICIANCPVQTIHRVDGRARVFAARCIYCYCCHEFCPEQAIELRRSPVGKVMARI